MYPSPAPPPKLQEQFWEGVRDLLTERHGRSRLEADQGVETFRREVDSHEFHDAVFNQGEEQTAEVVNRVIQAGLPQAGLRPKAG